MGSGLSRNQKASNVDEDNLKLSPQIEKVTSTAPSAPSISQPPQGFAIMRSVHEALRMSIYRLQPNIDKLCIERFALEWVNFRRALSFHMEMENADLFRLLDSHSDGKCTSEKLHEEHDEDIKLLNLLSDQTRSDRLDLAIFNTWKDEHLKHLVHEENVMQPITIRTGATDIERTKVVYEKIVSPAFQRNETEFIWFVGWVVSMLNQYGSTNAPPAAATRVFCHGLHHSCNQRID